MVKDLVKLVEELNKKVAPLVEAIEKADPTTKEYGVLLDNYGGTMSIISTINRTLVQLKEVTEKEVTKDESNN